MIDVQTAAADALLASHVGMVAGYDGVDADFRIRIEAAIIKRLHSKGEGPCAAVRSDAGGAWDRRRQRRGAAIADVLQARYLAATTCLTAGPSTILVPAVLVHTVEFFPPFLSRDLFHISFFFFYFVFFVFSFFFSFFFFFNFILPQLVQSRRVSFFEKKRFLRDGRKRVEVSRNISLHLETYSLLFVGAEGDGGRLLRERQILFRV